MKMTSKALSVAALLLSMVAVPLRAQTDVDTKKGEPAAVAKDEAVTNDGNRARESVRIDNTGIHVGGEEPVDINIPNFGASSGFLGPLLPIIAVVVTFGTPVAIVALFVALRHRRNRMMHETLRAMVEKGVPIPPQLLAGGGALPDASNGTHRGYKDLRWGLVLIALGSGLYILEGKIGIIPLFIGAALLLVWIIGLIANKRKNTTPQ